MFKTNIPAIICDSNKRHDLFLLWDATLCNPNGNPDADNQQRIDWETQRAYTTDASLKRRLRDTVHIISMNEKLKNTGIFIQRDTFLSNTIGEAFELAGNGNGEIVEAEATPKSKGKKAQKVGKDEKDVVNKYLRDNYWDVRMFGGVLIASSGSDKSKNGGKVTGPLQVGFSLSVDPVSSESLSITRVCGDKPKTGDDSAAQTMGRKEIIHYGLFKTPVFYNPNIKSDSVSDKDLELFWFALLKMWDMTKTSSKNLSLQKAIVFTHDSKYGNAPANQLFDMINVKSKIPTPRSVHDYSISFDSNHVPDGVTATVLY